ncbi:ParB/RepB/Spo0J family partition protein [Marinicauda algicola]|uniref:ParB/RepB/Spo0J family partition protein n=1 Tax=Marinicauda algicola TaxID=2029849 RepID=A0A4S2H0F3_9PROT|nr:ParB/RepB/Spo0J family partition protein [Marinicauda algicola]TGY89007.1 ParB/RepB/Spo0J family partition protein [Marinicauda algicola]
MSAEKETRTRGLGRGLSALFDEGEEADAIRGESAAQKPADAAGVREIPIELIEPNPDQPRKRFTEADLAELAESVAEKGLLQPLLVRPLPGDGDRYQIVAGERRWRAAQRARLHQVPVIVREFTDRETLEIAIVENVQRADLNAVEEARAFKQLIENFGHTQDEVARAVGKSRAHIANTLRLLALPRPVLDRLEAGEITPGHARAIASATDPAALAERIVREGLSVRAAESLARQSGAPTRPGSGPKAKGGEKDPDTRALEADLSDRLGLEVDLRHAGEAGELRIRYSSLEQLDDLCRRLSQAGK